MKTLPMASMAGLAGREVIVYFDQNRDPVKNLIREEELFQRVESGGLPELVRLWVNSECLVRGRARSSKYGWYDERLATELGVLVVERSTGGGVVYQDGGNLNWSFFLRTPGTFLSPTRAFGQASGYMIRALERRGVRARFSPPNRIDVDGRKISGMAARSTVHTVLVHGTLLLSSDLEKLNRLCIPPADCPAVSNVSEWVEGLDAEGVLGELVGVLEDSGFQVTAREPW